MKRRGGVLMLWPFAAFCLMANLAIAQCPQFTSSSISGNTQPLCEGASVTLTVAGLDIPVGSTVDWYIGFGTTFDPYAGEGTLIGSVPVQPDPFLPGAIIIDPYIWTVPATFCETEGGGVFWITGIINPPPAGICLDIYTSYYGLEINCPELILSGGGEVCAGNCPDDPTEINFSLSGSGTPFIADIIVTASVFPPFEIEDLEISNGQSMFICLNGFFPSFDPSTGILNVPILAIGITATVEIVSITTSTGCPVSMGQNSITLSFIAAPTANGGSDQTICEGEDVSLSGSIGGSAIEGTWTSSGDGTFDDPFDLAADYTPGPGDIANGQVILTLTSTDANGTCIPATSDMVVTIDPSWTIEVGPPQTICNNDIVNVMAVMNGPPATGFWSTSGDGDFDDPDEAITIYTPGVLDLAGGSVTLFYTMDNNGPCTAPAEPLEITFVEAPDVDIPSNIEVCTDDSVTIHIGLSGNYIDVMWSTSGDGELIVISDNQINYTPGPDDIINQIAIISVTVTSGFPQCGTITYNLPVEIYFCDCPELETSPPPGPLCAINDMLDLSLLLVEGGSGVWSISALPPGTNPAELTGSVFLTDDSDPGIYTVTYTLNTIEPGCPGTSSQDIQVQGEVVPSAGADMAFCGAQNILLAGELTPAVSLPVLWESLGDGTFTDPSALSTTYIPGSLDSMSAGLYLVLQVLDPVCGDRSDTVTLFINQPPFAVLANDTIVVCNSAANGSVINFSSLVTGGDTGGTWTNVSGVAVDFSNPLAVDFNGIGEGYYLFQYQTNSAVSPCGETVYDLIVSVEACACPLLIVQNLPGGICNDLDSLPLDAFIMAGAPGNWQLISGPPGLNPATVSGSTMIIDGCDPGLYTLRFTFDAAPIIGCPDSAEMDFFIQEVMTLDISGDTSTCGQTPVQLDAAIGGSATGVVWMTSGLGVFADPNGLSTMYVPAATDVASANILLVASALDTFGFCPIPSDTISLFLVTPPSTLFSALSDTLCNHLDSGSVINLFSFIVSGDGTGFWTDLDGSMVDLSDPSQVDFAGVNAGSYRLLYTTQTALAPCTDSTYTFTVTVEDCACPSIVISPDDLILCQGTSADLNAQLMNADPGTWSVYSGPAGIWPVITGTVISTDNAAGGAYVLKYTLTDSMPGCPASATLNLLIETPPAFDVLDLICDADHLFYEIIIQTEANFISADVGTVTSSGPGEFKIDSVPAGQDVEILATGVSGLCVWIFNVVSPDCSCTLFTEDLADTIRFCPGDTFVLIPIVTGAQGLPFSTWITPYGIKMQPALPVYQEGEYIWIVRDMAGCEERDTFYAAFLGPAGAVISTIPPTCPGQTDGEIVVESIIEGSPPFMLQLDGAPPVMVFQFPYVFSQVGLGEHVITVTDMIGCALEFGATLENAEFGVLDIGPDVVIQKGDSTLIEPIAEGIKVMSITWVPAMQGQGLDPFWMSPETTLLLSAIVQDSAGCLYEDELRITVVEKESFFIPNVFSPNGDQMNDVAQVVTNLPDNQLVSFEIFDRWGSLLFGQYGNPPFQWEGNSGGEEVQSGVYVYKLLWKDLSGNPVVRIGDITLLR